MSGEEKAPRRLDIAERIADQLADLVIEVAAELKKDSETFLREHQLITTAQAATFLGVTENWVREHTASGELPTVRLGALVRYHPPTLLAWALDTQEAARD